MTRLVAFSLGGIALCGGLLLPLHSAPRGTHAGAARAAMSDCCPKRVVRTGAPTLIAVKTGAARRCLTSSDPTVVRELLDMPPAKAAERPAASASWTLAVFTGSKVRSFSYWPESHVLGELRAPDKLDCEFAPEVDRVLQRMVVSPAPRLAGQPTVIAPHPTMPVFSPVIVGLDSMVAEAGHVFAGRVVGVSESTLEGDPPGSGPATSLPWWTSQSQIGRRLLS